jgi:hypothetical protein
MAISTAEEEVQAISDQFYDALGALLNGDAGPLAGVWSHEDDVTTIYPVTGSYTTTRKIL